MRSPVHLAPEYPVARRRCIHLTAAPLLAPLLGTLLAALVLQPAAAWAQQPPVAPAVVGKLEIPRHQSQPPGPPLSPDEALRKMTVPDGFRVELVAAEPDVQNPVAMAFDERGRIWITESFEYPRREPGPGRDRIKILEDTDGDGRVDSVKIFADGLNIPSGIAIGHGGVWVANAPDILFLRDTDGDDRADTTEVIATGFGRADTHELPNSLTWGPDGWLYGLNGVFNPSRVVSGDRVFEFTCAMFRIDPVTRKFELFSQGTSNPWGIAFDPRGEAFVSACVIDHLWHLSETGYYHRQGGPYPPHTWKIESIVDYKHQMAAYCGITYLDTPAYPAAYRDCLVMGNIHGNCLNVDRLDRHGSTYRGVKGEDLLSGNDAWFMPVVQKVGPDGCLYVLDWYDRYHCYQDANADPEGVDRSRGRLYRIVHEPTGRPSSVSLAGATDDALVDRLSDPNVYLRETARRLLVERQCDGVVPRLEALACDASVDSKTRMNALWSLIGAKRLSPELAHRLLDSDDALRRAWGVRAVGDLLPNEPALAARCLELARDASPDVRLQVAVAVGKLAGVDPLKTWVTILAEQPEDPQLPQIVWQNLHPQLPSRSDELLGLVEQVDLEKSPGLAALLAKVAEKLQ